VVLSIFLIAQFRVNLSLQILDLRLRSRGIDVGESSVIQVDLGGCSGLQCFRLYHLTHEHGGLSVVINFVHGLFSESHKFSSCERLQRDFTFLLRGRIRPFAAGQSEFSKGLENGDAMEGSEGGDTNKTKCRKPAICEHKPKPGNFGRINLCRGCALSIQTCISKEKRVYQHPTCSHLNTAGIP